MSEDIHEMEKRKPGRPAQERRGRAAFPKNRPERADMNVRGPLTYSPTLMKDLKSQGLTPRLVNDKPGRIDHFLEEGWKFVQADGQIGDDKAAAASKVGGNLSKHVGNGVQGYLMVRPTEWYEEDQRHKIREVVASEAAMKAPPKGSKLKGGEVGEAYGPGLTND